MPAKKKAHPRINAAELNAAGPSAKRAAKPAAQAPEAVVVPLARHSLHGYGRRAIFIRGGPPMAADKLRLALAGVDADNPVWRAVNQILDEEFASAALDASEPTDLGGTYPGGRMAALGELKARLHDLREGGVSARNG